MPPTSTNQPAVVNRRTLLASVGATGVAGFAGCADDDDGTDSGSGSGGDDDPLFPLSVQLEVNADNDDRVQMVELIAESLEQSGYFETEIETYEWNTYIGRVLDPEYQENGFLPCIGLSGTFNPHSFCDALHHSSNIGACCNLNGIDDPEIDELLDSARFGTTVAEDLELRRETYDEIWHRLATERYSSITHFDLQTAVTNTDVHGFNMWPFNEGIFSYNLYSPQDEQVIWLDTASDAHDTDLDDLQTGGTLRGALAANIDSFDPPNSSDTTSTIAQGFIFEGLTTSDAEGNVYPWLAERYELLDVQDVDRSDYVDYMQTVETDEEGVPDTDDYPIIQDAGEVEGEARILTHEDARTAAEDGTYGMHFRYHLHEGVEFHNGDELTASDVIATYEYYEDTVLAPQTFDSVLAVIEVDEYTVDIYAQVPDAEGERELPGALILNGNQIDGMDGGDLDPREGTVPVGTGPYEFDDFEDEQYLELTKFDDYWVEQQGVDVIDWFDGPADYPDGPVIDAIELEIVPDDATRSAALQNDEVDITYGLASSTLDDFDADGDFIVHGVETGGYEYIQYPMNVEPWNDPRLRQAVNHLIPRAAIVENVLNGWARPAWTDLPELAHGSGTVDHDALEAEIRPLNEFDPERAAELLEDVAADH